MDTVKFKDVEFKEEGQRMSTIEFQTSIRNGTIQIPREYQNDFQDASAIKVIIQKVDKEKKLSSTGIISQLIQNPILVKNFKPLAREEAHERD